MTTARERVTGSISSKPSAYTEVRNAGVCPCCVCLVSVWCPCEVCVASETLSSLAKCPSVISLDDPVLDDFPVLWVFSSESNQKLYYQFALYQQNEINLLFILGNRQKGDMKASPHLEYSKDSIVTYN